MTTTTMKTSKFDEKSLACFETLLWPDVDLLVKFLATKNIENLAFTKLTAAKKTPSLVRVLLLEDFKGIFVSNVNF